ncbi:hypothetical protein D9757_013559 [Collybiopsis confluens]|uniref:Ricin B lectin domain-containing protein n=1 Tax=Collybiopsis confluens TaxID=2823264 RepID=A0A8H5FR79_9AGAR|nr:hypothetical protein D9757_013559 [Collybiopsis confluens]
MALRGAYFIRNARVPIVIDLNGGLTANGTRVTSWAQTEWANATQFSAANQLWLITPVPQTSDTYTVQNIRSGTFLDLSGSNSNNRTPITGWANNNSNNQRWVIRTDRSGFYKFQNVASSTFMDLLNGGTANGTLITGWSGQWDATGESSHHQQWSLQRVSQRSTEVHSTLRRNPELSFDFQSYQVDADYIILPEGIWRTIWNGSGLASRSWRSEIFDFDDFAFGAILLIQ